MKKLTIYHYSVVKKTDNILLFSREKKLTLYQMPLFSRETKLAIYHYSVVKKTDNIPLFSLEKKLTIYHYSVVKKN